MTHRASALFSIFILVTLAGCSKKAETPAAPAKQAPAPAAKGEPAAELPEGPRNAAASSGEGDYKPAFAIDGDPSTRWGSDFSDEQWLIVDFGKTQEIAGARIDWETAYGKDYDLLASLDKKTWKKISSVREGDGGVDEMFFKPVQARFLKMQGIKRGTGWGYSLWEIQAFKAGDQPELKASSSAKGRDAANALDGDDATAWQAGASGAASLSVDFHKIRQLGGLEIRWGEAAPAKYSIETSVDGTEWKEGVRVVETDGGRDLVFFPASSCRWLRINVDGPAAVSISEIGLKGGEEDLTLARRFEAVASRLPDGALPRWLTRRQTFWTITGAPGDTEETLLGDEGTVEPYKDSFCVMPVIKLGDKVLTSANFERKHLLEDGYLPLPTVVMTGNGLEVRVGTVTYGPAGSSTTAARYQVKNTGAAPVKAQLNLMVWPLQLNPPWQYGGVSPIKEAKFDPNKALQINGKPAITPLEMPGAVAAASQKEGTAFGWVRSGQLPNISGATDAEGAVSALYQYNLDLKPGEMRTVVMLFPLHEGSPTEAKGKPDEFFAKVFDEEKQAWKKQLATWKIHCPLERLENVVKSNLAYIMLNRDLAAAQPGPRNYAKAWMRDGAVSTAVYLRFGFIGEAKAYLEWFTPLIGQDGFVPFLLDSKTGKMPDWCRDWKEYDSQGEYVYAVRKYYDFTRDKALLEKVFPAVERAMAYQKARLEERRTEKYANTKFYGVLPESNSHEGYFPGVHSYWDDFWGIRGYADAAYLADQLGKSDKAKEFRDEEERFRKDLFASMKKTMEMGRKPYIPGCAEKCDFDATSTSIGLTAGNELSHLQGDDVLSKALKTSYDMYVDGLKPRYTGGVWGSYTPYEARNIEALVKLGRREDALRLFDFLTGGSMRPAGWNLLAEVVHYEPATGSYIGDMPHTWVGADLVNAARSFFVLDDGPVTTLAAGVPEAWLETGKGVSVENLPTENGVLSYKIERTAPAEIILEASGQAAPPEGFIFKHPFGAKVKAVSVNGRDEPVSSEGVRFHNLPAKVTLTLGS